MRLTEFSREHFIGGDTGLPMDGVGTSDPPSEVLMEHFWAAEDIFTEVTIASEVPMEELILAESILSEFTWDFRHWSDVPIKDQKFRHFENQPNKR